MIARLSAAAILGAASAFGAASAQQGDEPVTHYEATSGPASIVDGLHEALTSENKELVRQLLEDNVLIAADGAAERSFEDYSRERLAADMHFMAGAAGALKKRDEFVSGDLAVIVSEFEMNGEAGSKRVKSRMIETAVLKRHDLGWMIQHIHWSTDKGARD